MIRTQELVNDYYIEKSRDFQILCRILDYMFNATKYNSDSMLKMTDTELAKDSVLPLIGDKFGIYDKDAYSTREMLDALPCAIKSKGALHSVKTLINAYLDSMDVFDYAVVYNAKDKKSAREISNILNRKVNQYTLVIVLSTFPNLTKLRILDVYLRMVIPTGTFVEYVFGYSKQTIDDYKYEDYVLLYYTREEFITMGDEEKHQRVSTVRNSQDSFIYDNTEIENVSDPVLREFLENMSRENTKLVQSVGISSAESSDVYNYQKDKAEP